MPGKKSDKEDLCLWEPLLGGLILEFPLPGNVGGKDGHNRVATSQVILVFPRDIELPDLCSLKRNLFCFQYQWKNYQWKFVPFN